MSDLIKFTRKELDRLYKKIAQQQSQCEHRVSSDEATSVKGLIDLLGESDTELRQMNSGSNACSIKAASDLKTEEESEDELTDLQRAQILFNDWLAENLNYREKLEQQNTNESTLTRLQEIAKRQAFRKKRCPDGEKGCSSNSQKIFNWFEDCVKVTPRDDVKNDFVKFDRAESGIKMYDISEAADLGRVGRVLDSSAVKIVSGRLASGVDDGVAAFFFGGASTTGSKVAAGFDFCVRMGKAIKTKISMKKDSKNYYSKNYLKSMNDVLDDALQPGGALEGVSKDDAQKSLIGFLQMVACQDVVDTRSALSG